ncbi:winged helix-turn-helix transcriptional regulator [Microbacterium sp. ZW T5_45]|uniref:winged helix-turn-helix transcriptional regulator n=1 Tax=Microbacterium sp. ZW T5_45 TaxID=3378080 RepID=UPI003854A74D
MDLTADDITWTDPTCPVARILDLVGDRWSLLIVRDAMDGARSFTDFVQRTGVARNILTERLRRLTEHGILERVPATTGRRQVYALTEVGRDLFPVVVAMRQWGERHAFRDGEPRSVLVDRTGASVATIWPVDSRGDRVDVDSTEVVHPR